MYRITSEIAYLLDFETGENFLPDLFGFKTINKWIHKRRKDKIGNRNNSA